MREIVSAEVTDYDVRGVIRMKVVIKNIGDFSDNNPASESITELELGPIFDGERMGGTTWQSAYEWKLARMNESKARDE